MNGAKSEISAVGTVSNPPAKRALIVDETPPMQAWYEILEALADLEEDVRKGALGNRSAATRVRKAMQAVREAAKKLRVLILASSAKK